MKQIITSRSAIENVLNGRCVYVDKTAYMHKLITTEDNLFFISRPRRFGKSLMLSTLKAIFEGRKELFEGCAIAKTDYDWKKYPVLYFDMSDAVGESIESVKAGLNTLAMSAAEQLELNVTRNDDPSQTFLNFFNGMRGAKLGHETQTANGRIDAVIETPKAVYIFEFKCNHTAQEAFNQIIEKRYHEPYLTDGKPVYGIGLNFNPEKGSRGVEDPVVGEIEKGGNLL